MEDKRVKHTKKRIKEAMLDCLKDTSLDHISVKRICDVADINRSTFYAYYSDPLELYALIEKEAIDGFKSTTDLLKANKVSYKEFLKQIVEYIGDNSKTFLALIHTNQEGVKHMNLSFLENENIHQLFGGKNINPYVMEFYLGGTLALITKWLESGKKESPEEIAELMFNLNN